MFVHVCGRQMGGKEVEQFEHYEEMELEPGGEEEPAVSGQPCPLGPW